MVTMRGRGIIIPVEWDDEGGVVAIAISTHGEEEYLIDTSKKGDELRQFLRQEVEISGEVRIRGGKKFVIVENYSLRKVFGDTEVALP